MINDFQAWFLSDLHIKSEQDPKALILIKWLESLGLDTPATHLFLLGDIFDYWLGSGSDYQLYFPKLTQALSQLDGRGIKVTYIEGNHDIHINKFWRQRKVSVFQIDQKVRIGETNFYLSHGDYINSQDLAYHRYIRWARGRWGQLLIQCFSVQQWQKLGRWISERSRRHSSQRGQTDRLKIRGYFADFAYQIYQKNKVNYIIAGHIHQKIEIKLEPFSAYAINLGCWHDGEFPVLKINQHGFTWLDLKALNCE